MANGKVCRVGVSVDRLWDSVRRRAGHVRAQGAGAETWHQDEMLTFFVFSNNPPFFLNNNHII